jgi:hypothetical protein
MSLDRRTALAALLSTSAGLLLPARPASAAEAEFRLATFQADITPPLGHPLLGGLIAPAKAIKDRLEARGLVLLGGEKPRVICMLDWGELRNDAYDTFRDHLADAVGTDRQSVLLTCVHQHDAPYCDLTAQKLLAEAGFENALYLPAFLTDALDGVATAARDSVAKAVPITHFGTGAAEVQRIACNRRVELTPGQPNFSRLSFARDPAIRNAPEGPIDPQLQTLAFFREERLVATLSVYAVHPMSYYGRGEVSYDFPGMARAMLDQQQPGVFHLYASGCSGDVVAAKFNDGDAAARAALADRLSIAMSQSIEKLSRQPLEKIDFRNVALKLPPPETGNLAPERLQATLADAARPATERITAALGLSYWRRCHERPEIDVPVLDFGSTLYLVLPAEMFVEYQLAAQQMAPDKHVLVAGFGECAPGYIPTTKARAEGFAEEHGYCWVQAKAEEAILAALREGIIAR